MRYIRLDYVFSSRYMLAKCRPLSDAVTGGGRVGIGCSRRLMRSPVVEQTQINKLKAVINSPIILDSLAIGLIFALVALHKTSQNFAPQGTRFLKTRRWHRASLWSIICSQARIRQSDHWYDQKGSV